MNYKLSQNKIQIFHLKNPLPLSCIFPRTKEISFGGSSTLLFSKFVCHFAPLCKILFYNVVECRTNNVYLYFKAKTVQTKNFHFSPRFKNQHVPAIYFNKFLSPVFIKIGTLIGTIRVDELANETRVAVVDFDDRQRPHENKYLLSWISPLG
jgi:hypothetical protein